ncbi:hypothetical protein GGTG_10221 [Gaeumannomyces tritici R3-111a-1]|uniref:Uncharacterized protein n=1 Tax=Gaeumannomyces tritici (strain R3-111a-1) TaxID=644352 RepID=J3P9P4_GAET3|nr:hypothetical protein GGTG_10221 [Gaeumannomyces tritici R3-111a-1]EJT73380.1 hypothetical protein GGTG_10221 [Gaeumannomyces tritici R3-111a-1]
MALPSGRCLSPAPRRTSICTCTAVVLVAIVLVAIVLVPRPDRMGVSDPR